MKIKNFEALAKTGLRRAALAAAEAGLEAIDTKKVVSSLVRDEGETIFIGGETYPLSSSGKLHIVGLGKCALLAGRALEEILGDKIAGGIILDPNPAAAEATGRLNYCRGDHPFPSQQNVDCTGEIIVLLQKLTGEDLVIFIISGGGSTLLCQPKNKTCFDEALLMRRLFARGATIREINLLRKHTSLARGGSLARFAYPARGAALIFSDVPGDDLGTVASGPTVRDETVVREAAEILRRYGLTELGWRENDLLETPKEEKYFAAIRNILAVSNKMALEAMAGSLRQNGFEPEIGDLSLQGEAREVGERLAVALDRSPSPGAFLYGGETTVTVRGEGKGGRNQELALAALSHLGEGELVLTLASDGRDNSESAGAIADIETRKKAEALGLVPADALARNDSFNFFRRTDDLIQTGPTGSNVSDLTILLKES